MFRHKGQRKLRLWYWSRHVPVWHWLFDWNWYRLLDRYLHQSRNCLPATDSELALQIQSNQKHLHNHHFLNGLAKSVFRLPHWLNLISMHCSVRLRRLHESLKYNHKNGLPPWKWYPHQSLMSLRHRLHLSQMFRFDPPEQRLAVNSLR